MTNHVHLLLTPPAADACAVLMRRLGQRYVQYFNGRYDRTGTLWEGRFRSCMVDSPEYVLACYRYIERNPLRAGMVKEIGDYRWASYAGNAGVMPDSLLMPHVEYLALGENDRGRHDAYRRLFSASGDDKFLGQVRDATKGGYPLLGERTKARLAAISSRPLARRKPGPRPADVSGGCAARSGDLPF
jgi:putative transposase